MASKKYAAVDQKQCVACGVCMKECPMNAIKIWKGCYAVIDKEICIGCAKCARNCPVGCIRAVNREDV